MLFTEAILNNFIKDWEEKIAKEKLLAQFNENLEKEKKQHPTLTDDEAKFRALRLTTIQLKRINLVPTTQFLGFIYACGDVVDVGELMSNKAKQLYEENPEKAIREKIVKIVDDKIIALDNREFFANGNKNPNYAKPIQKRKIKTVFGIARKKDELQYKKFMLTLTDEHSKLSFPLFIPIKFSCSVNARDTNDDEFRLNSNSTTFFEKATDILDYKELILKCCRKNLTTLKDLKVWQVEHKDDRNELAIVEADVINLSTTPSGKGNYGIILDDGLAVEDAVSGYMGEYTYRNINFGADSKIIAIGRPFIMTDSETQEERLMFDVKGAWAYPEYQVPKAEPIVDDEEVW